ncbi:MAG: hypothetical protein NT135_01975 [Candidatus Berkelbacteria bacterium]|nr:hypothetical protein [Candidatus Berkelbacteria bacterium]
MQNPEVRVHDYAHQSEEEELRAAKEEMRVILAQSKMGEHRSLGPDDKEFIKNTKMSPEEVLKRDADARRSIRETMEEMDRQRRKEGLESSRGNH